MERICENCKYYGECLDDWDYMYIYDIRHYNQYRAEDCDNYTEDMEGGDE